jgi:hypothetical protein
MRILRTTLTALTLTLSACGGSGSTAPGGNGGGPSASLSIAIADPFAVGTSVQATATITDIYGVITPATNVTWSSLDPSVVSVDASGLVTGKLVGMGAIRATSGALSKDRVVTVKPGPPARVSIYAGDNQVANRGASVSDPLCVLVVDAYGNVIPGEVVYYTVTTGGGSLQTPTAPATDAGGVAISGIWQLGSLAGEQNVRASTSNGLSVTFKATAQ